MGTHAVGLALRWADDAALLPSSRMRAGSAAGVPARTGLLRTAGPHLPREIAAAHVLRVSGLSADTADSPLTAEEPAASETADP